MLKLSYMLLRKRKGFVTAIIGIISMSAMLAIFANMTADSIYQQKKELALKTYGSFICGVNELTAEDVKKINKNENTKSGFFELYQNTILENSIFTIGYGDTNFMDMANAVLEEGVLPTGNNEIAVERFVAQMYGVSKPGVDIELSINGTKKSVRLTGIIRNYSNSLNVHYRLEKGVNNYPNIFCSSRSDFYLGEEQTSRSVLFGFHNSTSIGTNQLETIYKMRKDIDGMKLSASVIYDNDNLFNRGLLYCNEMKWLCNIFSAIIIFSTIFCSWSLLRVFYRDYGKKLAVFMACGLRKRQALGIVGVQLIFFLILSSCISIFGGMVLDRYLGKVLFPAIPNAFKLSNLKFLYLWFAIFVVLSFFLFYKISRILYKTSISGNLSKGILYLQKKLAKKPLDFNIMKTMSYPTWGATLLFVFLFCICFGSLYSYHATQTDYNGYPDYELYAKEITETERVAGYEIEYNPDTYISEKALDELKIFGEDVRIDSVPNVNSNTLLLQKSQESSYFKNWQSVHALEPTEYNESIIRSNWPNEANELIPIPNVAFVVADEQQLQQIGKEHNLEVNLERMLEEPEVLLFLPGSDDIADVGIRAGDKVSLGGINLRGQDVSFYCVDVNVQNIIKTPYELTMKGYKQERNQVTVVVSSKFAKQEEFFKGYSSLNIYLASQMDKKSERELDNCINKIQSEVQGGAFYSKGATQEAEAIYSTYVRSLGIAMMVIVLIFTSIFIYVQIYNSLKEKEKEYGILRAMGASAGTLSQNIFLSYVNSMFLSLMIDIVVMVLFLRDFSLFSNAIGDMLRSWGVVVILVLIGKLLPAKVLSKAAIRQMINS